VKAKHTTASKGSNGYVPCLPEYEGDLKDAFDFSKPITMEEIRSRRKKSTKKAA
jgi:hypothetical protein